LVVGRISAPAKRRRLMSKMVTVRLPDGQVIELEELATFDGVSLAEEIREAVKLLVRQRSNDPEFVQRVRAKYEQAARKLEELEGAKKVREALGSVESPQVEAALRSRAANEVAL
jgi:hypothetical protein